MATKIHPPTECARLGAEAIRQLNQRTIWPDDATGYRYPSDVYQTLTALHVLVAGLPQALDQVAAWLNRSLGAGEVQDADGGDAENIVSTITALLDEAGEALEQARASVDYAANATSALSRAGVST